MADHMVNDRWISLQEVCDHPGVKRNTVTRRIERRDMPASKVGRLWRYNIAEVDERVRSGGASGGREASE